jgi:hypothetical protein
MCSLGVDLEWVVVIEEVRVERSLSHTLELYYRRMPLRQA